MNIALCLSGQPRDLEEGINSLKKNILNCNPNYQFNIFAHCWYDETLIGKPFDSAQKLQDKKMGVWKTNTPELIHSLKPKDLWFEYPQEFKEFHSLTLTDDASQSKMASLFYSIWQANEMKKNYEKVNRMTFDLVIRSRYDLFFYQSLDIKSLNLPAKDFILSPSRFQEIRQNVFNGGKTLTDLFAVGTSKSMDVFCGVYPNFKNLYTELRANGEPPYGENFLGRHVRTNCEIPVYCEPKIDFQLVRNR